jgi:hypothetical protein
MDAYPGGVVDRVVKLSNGEYEVHYIGVNWPHHTFVNQDVKVPGPDALQSRAGDKVSAIWTRRAGSPIPGETVPFLCEPDLGGVRGAGNIVVAVARPDVLPDQH